MTKKTTKKVNEPSYIVNLDSIETLEDIPVAWGLAKQEAGLAITDEELIAICMKVCMECGTRITTIICECEKKQPWYKRLWKKLKYTFTW